MDKLHQRLSEEMVCLTEWSSIILQVINIIIVLWTRDTRVNVFRNQAEMAHTCRGTISLHGAIIHTEHASSNFVVSNGGGTQTFHLKATSEVERQKWVTSLELAKAKAIQVYSMT